MNGALLVLKDTKAWFMGATTGFYELDKGFLADARAIHVNATNVYFTNKGERCYVDRNSVKIFIKKGGLRAVNR